MSISPASSTVRRGDVFDVAVKLEDATDIRSYEFTMDFDPNIVQVEGVVDTGFLGSTGRTVIAVGPDIDNAAGKVTFGAFSHDAATPGPDAPEPRSLAVITLRAVGLGETDLHLHDVKWGTAASQLEVTALTTDLDNWTAEEGQIFHVTATVHNAGDVDALGVSASLEQTGGTGSATCTGPKPERAYRLRKCESADFEWTCECTAGGTFEYTATPSGLQEEIPDTEDGHAVSTLEVGIDLIPFAPPWDNYVPPEEETLTLGTTETANVVILGARNLGRYRFTMDFNPNVVHVLDVQDASFLGSTGRTVFPLGPDIDNVAGTVTFEAISAGPPAEGPDGSGVLATITMEMVGVGNSDLDLHDVEVSTTLAEQEVPNVVRDGQITVYPVLTVTSDGCCPISVEYDGVSESVPAGGTEIFTNIPGGTVVTLTADDSDPCCEFDQWVVDGAPITDNPITVLMDSNHTAVATCLVPSYTLTTVADPSEGGTVTGGGTYDCCTTVTVEAIPAGPCWYFVGWGGDLSGTENPTTIHMDGDKTVIAHFAKYSYTLTVDISPESGGDVKVNGVAPPSYPTEYTFDCCTNVNLEAVAAEGYEFVEWIGDLTGTENPTTIHMDSNKAITATFSSVYRLYKLYLPIIMKNYIP